MSLNRCEFIGNLGKDPEVTNLNNGQKIARISIAVSESYKDQAGQVQTKTEWIPCIAWNTFANTLEHYAKKGDRIYLAGKFATTTWKDDGGNTRSKTEIVIREITLLTPKPKSDPQPSMPQAALYQGIDQAINTPTQNQATNDQEDLPF